LCEVRDIFDFVKLRGLTKSGTQGIISTTHIGLNVSDPLTSVAANLYEIRWSHLIVFVKDVVSGLDESIVLKLEKRIRTDFSEESLNDES